MTGQTDASASRPQPGRPEEVVARPSVADWVQLVRSEYLEMPTLCLTTKQVRRLWNLDDYTCNAVIDALMKVNFLRRTSAGVYVHEDGGAK